MKISKEIVLDLWKTEKMQNFQNLFRKNALLIT